MRVHSLGVLLCLCLASPAAADERAVSFRREVIPVLTKHGCATGACHGSPSGKGGFRLSLRGFDADFDEVTLAREALGRRVNSNDPAASLMLRKPLMEIAHGGGRRLRTGDHGYTILRDWITQGCRVDSRAGNVCVELVVEKYERLRQWPDVRERLRVMARFDDGAKRDVTALADFTSTDDTVVTVSAAGDVSGQDRGEATIVVRYLDQIAVAPLTILKPVEGFAWPDPPANNEIDRLLFAKQRQLQIVPSELCSDGEFIRRMFLDVLGVLPNPDETRSFLADATPTKRAVLIDRVLERDEYAEFWSLKWGDLLQVKGSKLSPAGVHKFHRWLLRAMRDNIPYDRFAAELLTAQGSTFEHPPANFYRAASNVDACSEAVSQVFLGIRMQCAKCHNHPYERWTQDNYYGLGAVFSRVQRRTAQDSDEQTIWLADAGEVTQPRTGQTIRPLVPLGGFIDVPPGTDRRAAFVKWLIDPTNPFFAKVGVNRLWGHVMGRGLVEPVDDFRDSNPASHPELLDFLASEFGRNGFDQKHVLRLILNSRTYQLSSRTNRFNERDAKLFSHAAARPLTAEPLLDAICSVTGVPEKYVGLPAGTRATQLPSPDVGSDFLKVFGQPARNTVCDCERSREPKLSQTLQLLSGDFLAKKLGQPQSRLSRHLSRRRTDLATTEPPPANGLKLWLRADAGVLDSQGTDATEAESVATWRDVRDASVMVTQADVARRPTFVARGPAGRSALRFDGDDFLNHTASNLVPSGAARTVLVVAHANETSSGGSLFTFGRSTAGAKPVCTCQLVALGGTFYIYSDGVNSAGNSAIPSAIDTIRKPFVATFASPGAGHKLAFWLNGQHQSVTQPGTVGADTGTLGFTVGNREDYPGFGWNGLIYEVLVYDRALGDDELIALHRQLIARNALDTSAAPAKEQPTADTESADRAFVTELYLAAFSRAPESEEVATALRHLQQLDDRREGLGDVIWAVLNSKEFLFQH